MIFSVEFWFLFVYIYTYLNAYKYVDVGIYIDFKCERNISIL